MSRKEFLVVLKLKEIRIKKGLFQKDIADILGVQQQAVSKYEKGIHKLDHQQIIDLCLALEVTPIELLGYEEEYKKYTEYLMRIKKEGKR